MELKKSFDFSKVLIFMYFFAFAIYLQYTVHPTALCQVLADMISYYRRSVKGAFCEIFALVALARRRRIW